MSYVYLEDALGNTLNVAAWDDLRAPASGINPTGSPSAATPNTVDGSLTFSKGNVAIAWFQMPHNWKLDSDVHFHIHWSKSSTNNGVCNWQVKHKWGNIGEVMPAFNLLSKGTVVVSDSNTTDKHAMLEWTFTGAGKTLSSMICVYLARISDGDDTFTGTGNLYEMDIHYQIDSMGSRQELIK